MKKFTLSLLVIVSLFSCKEKLPSNISFTLSQRNEYQTKLNQLESIINPLTDSDISKLSKDSLFNLYTDYDFNYDFYKKYDDELDELLKFNPEYSSHPDMVKVYREEKVFYGDFLNKINKIKDTYYSID
jgi:hypothetical protein